MKTLAFDVYGTLIDTQGVLAELENMIGDKAGSFSATWRAKQLEYSFRKGLMERYQNFELCTSQALNYSCATLQVSLTDTEKLQLLDAYKTLPTFSDVEKSLKKLSNNYRLFAFSNGSYSVVDRLLVNAGIRGFFIDIISTDEIRSFKPSPKVYQHLLHTAAATASDTWLVSSNPFDVIGALNADLNSVWLNRSGKEVFDPWDVFPNATLSSLAELAE